MNLRVALEVPVLTRGNVPVLQFNLPAFTFHYTLPLLLWSDKPKLFVDFTSAAYCSLLGPRTIYSEVKVLSTQPITIVFALYLGVANRPLCIRMGCVLNTDRYLVY